MKRNAIRFAKGLLAVLVLVASATAVFAADLSGTWAVDGAVYGNQVNYACTLKQDGENLSGTARLQDKDIPVTGTIREKAVSWKFEIEYNGAPLTLEFNGTLASDNEITGAIAVAGVTGDFTAKRK